MRSRSFPRVALLATACCLTLVACQNDTGGTAPTHASPAPAGSPHPVYTNSDGSFPLCTPADVSFTTAVAPYGAPGKVTEYDITTTLKNLRGTPCQLEEPNNCEGEPTVEVTNASGMVVWSPRYSFQPCVAPPPGRPPALVKPGIPVVAHVTWDLHECAPTVSCAPRTPAPPGTYVAKGYSVTVGEAQGATLILK